MPLPLRMLPLVATVTRPTHILASALAVPATLPVVGFTFPNSVYLLARSQGLDAPSTLDITGTLVGSGQTETVTLVNNAVARSTKQWSTVTQLVTTGATVGTVEVSAVYTANQPAASYQTVTTTLRCRLAASAWGSGDLVPDTQGLRLQQGYRCYFNVPPTVLVGDRLLIDGMSYVVEQLVSIHDQQGYHHTEAIIEHVRV